MAKSEVDPDAAPENRIGSSPPRTRMWQHGKLTAEGFPVAQISNQLERPGTVVWLDLCGPHGRALQVIAEELGLDQVAVEDAISQEERSKLDRYSDYLFLNVYWPRLVEGRLELHELSAFITERALVTVRQDDGFDIEQLIDRWDSGADLAVHGVSYLLYNLLDLVVDRHFDLVQILDDEGDALEDLLFDETSSMREVQQRSFRLRKNLVLLRRISLPMREIVNTLLRRDLHIVPPEMVPFYQDVYDHTLRAAEWADSLRDLIANLMDTRIALQGNRLNEVMKKVTSWAAIIAVPTAVTGFYGQNVPYPGYDRYWGFVVSTVIIIICSVGLYLVFKARDWL